MDLKTLGVSIDPRGARVGAAQINKEIERMGGTVRRVLTKADQEFAKFGRMGERSGGQIAKGQTNAVRGLKNTATQAKKTGEKVKAVGGDFAFLKAQSVLAASGMFRASQAMAVFGTAATGALAALAPLLAVLLPLIIAYKALSALIGAGVKGTLLAGEIQRLRISFTALTGTTKEADKVLGELRKTALETGISVGDQAKTVQKFIALGFDSTKAIKLQRNILDVAGAVGLTATEANLLGSALAQVQSKGVVSMEELRQQIAEKGIPAIDELMKKTGLFGKEFFDAIAKGSIASEELIDIFLNMEGGFAKFQGGAKRLAQSVPGQINIIKTSWEEMLRVFGAPLADAVGPILQDLINILQSGSGFAASFGQGIGDTIRILYGAISDGTLASLLGTAFMAGVEMGLNFLAEGFVKVVFQFVALFTSGLETAGGFVQDVLTTAFVAVINFFISGIEKGVQGVANILAKMATTANAIAGKDVVTVPAPFSLGSLGRVEAGPKVGKSFSENFANNSSFATGLTDEFGQNPFGTTFQDAAANQAFDLLDKSNQKTPKGSFSFAGEEKEGQGITPPGITPPGVDPKGKGGGAESTKEANEALEVQLGILGEVSQRIGELATDWQNLGAGIADIAEGSINSFADNLSTALVNVASGAESAGEAFRNMANAVIQSIVQMIIQMTVQLAIAQALTALGVPVGAIGAFQKVARAVPVSSHAGSDNGGTVRSGRSGFAKFHSGGLSSENLSLTEDNETVLTRRRAEEIERELRSSREERTSAPSTGGDRPLQIVNVLDQSEVLGIVAANPDVTVNSISRRRKQVEGLIKQK